MSWIILVAAALLEICWAIGLKFTEGWTRPLPSAFTAGCVIASLWLLSIATRSLPIGTAYAVWTGIGAAGTAVVGMVALGEPINALRIVSIVLIVAGVLGLKLA